MSCTTTLPLPSSHARWIISASYTYNDSTSQSAINKTVRNLVEYASANVSIHTLSSYHSSYSSYYSDSSVSSDGDDDDEWSVSLASHPLRFLEEVASEIGETEAVALACVTTYVRAVADEDEVFTRRWGGCDTASVYADLGVYHTSGGESW